MTWGSPSFQFGVGSSRSPFCLQGPPRQCRGHHFLLIFHPPASLQSSIWDASKWSSKKDRRALSCNREHMACKKANIFTIWSFLFRSLPISYLSITSTSEFKLFTLKFSKRYVCVYKYTYIFLLIHTHIHTEWLFDFIVKLQTQVQQKRQDTGVRIHWVLSIFEWRKATAFLSGNEIYLCWCSFWESGLYLNMYTCIPTEVLLYRVRLQFQTYSFEVSVLETWYLLC